MQAELYERQDDRVVIEVVDNSGSLHRVEVYPDGSIGAHRDNDYPLKLEDRTDEQERILQQVEARAKFHAHQATEYDTLPPMWDPDKIVEGIEALENLPIDEFAEQFRDFYDVLLDPDVAKEKYSFTGNVIFVTKAYCYNEELEITHVNSEVGVTYRQNGETDTVGGSTDCPSDTTKMVPCLPPIEAVNREIEYPEDFRDLCVNNLICQIRDIYRNMGEEPPADVDMEGHGKSMTLADGLVKRPDE